jgi:hypothetical protein
VVGWTLQAHDYNIEGTWQWNSLATAQADFPMTCGNNIGGLDGASDWMSNPANITIQQFWMDTFDYTSTLRTSTSTAWDWNQYGAAFKTQDSCFWDPSLSDFDYTHYRGLVDTVVSLAGSGSTYLKLTFAHDWSSTDLSGVSIGTGGVSFSFTSSSNSWQGTSNPYTWNH